MPKRRTRIGGIPEVIRDGVTGSLVPAGDAAAVAEAAEALIQDERRRRTIGAAAQQDASRFSADAIVPQYEALYRRLCIERKTRVIY